MEKKEFTRRHLPHFQTPGQAYFITWSLKDSIPSKSLIVYTERLKHLRAELESAQKNNAHEDLIIRMKMELALIRKKIYQSI